jgi:subfamily B ATP-binding cassette protein MsbA
MLHFSKRHLPLLFAASGLMVLSAIFDCAQIGAIIPLIDKIFTNNPIVLPKMVPAFLHHFADKINAMDRMVMFKLLLTCFPIAYIFYGLSSYGKGVLMDMVSQRTMQDVKNLLYRKYQDLSMDFYSKKRQGELMSRITSDVNNIGHSLSYGLSDSIYQSVLAVSFTIMALLLNWKMVFIILAIFPIMALLVYRIGKQLKQFVKIAQIANADLSTQLAETIQGVRIIKGFSREMYEVGRFESINKRIYKLNMKRVRRTLMVAPVTEFIAIVAVMVILLVGGGSVLRGEQSFGVFATLIAALLSIMRPVKKVAGAHNINQVGIAAAERVYEILDVKPTIQDDADAGAMPQPVNGITFDDVWFMYEKEDGNVLKGISHHFPVGKTTAIVGPTGCGKSTILNLFPRFYDPQKGTIKVDGVELRTYTMASIRGHIGMVTQEMILFHDTIRANIKYGRMDASEEDVIESCRKALAWEFIEKLPHGLDTIIGDRGFRLSGGQKQRLCIARAILRDPQILLLDEATSALDAESEQLVQKALDNLMEGRTVIVVAHRLSTIKHASCILLMQNGEVLQKGTHEELYIASPLYKKLADLNFTM